MACILLTDMDPPTSGPTPHQNGLCPHLDPAAGTDPKQEATDATCLTVHLYNLGKDGGGGGAKGSESVLTFPPGEYVAEELCICAAKACGESQEDFSSDVCPHTHTKYSFIIEQHQFNMGCFTEKSQTLHFYTVRAVENGRHIRGHSDI